MTTVVQFSVHGTPQPAGSKTAGRTKDGRMFVRDSAKRSAPWKQQVAQAAAAAHDGPLLDGPLELRVWFNVPRPKRHYGARGDVRPSAPTHPAVRPDITKLLRAVEDACTGVLWRDDAQIVAQHATKAYGERASCLVMVTPLGDGAVLSHPSL